MIKKIDEIKKFYFQILEQLRNKVSETNAFNSIKESYESLSLSRQKMIKNAILVLLFLCILVVPVFYFFSSVKKWNQFHTLWSLSFDLARHKDYNPKTLNQSRSMVKERLLNIITKYEDKNYTISDKKIPLDQKKIKGYLYTIEAGPLNVRQIIQMGTELDEMPYSYLSSLAMEESKKYPKHYEATFDLQVYKSKVQGGLLVKPNIKAKRLNIRRPRQGIKKLKLDNKKPSLIRKKDSQDKKIFENKK